MRIPCQAQITRRAFFLFAAGLASLAQVRSPQRSRPRNLGNDTELSVEVHDTFGRPPYEPMRWMLYCWDGWTYRPSQIVVGFDRAIPVRSRVPLAELADDTVFGQTCYWRGHVAVPVRPWASVTERQTWFIDHYRVA